jgi:peptide-methionine (S)-S-oxide reductase
MKNNNIKSAYLGGGCFWCAEAVFLKVRGVLSVTPGYSGGEKEDPAYEEICSGKTGHAEVVKIKYDESRISYENLLEIFFSLHNPTTLNRQGNDVGSQYRSVIFYETEKELAIANKVIDEIDKKGVYDDPIVTQVVPLEKFFEAEDYHQNYFAKNPEEAYCQAIIAPKVAKFRDKYSSFYRDEN